MEIAQRIAVRLGFYLVLLAAFALVPARAQAPIKAELPVLVTSSGQALDAFTVKTFLGRAGVENQYKALASTDDLKDVKTLVIAFGASVKGFGAASVSAETEIARTKAILNLARERKITLIGVHIGGAERRDGLSRQFVELVAPAVDYLVVWQDGNADGYFTKLAFEKKIPITVIPQPIEIGKTLAQVFGKGAG